MIRVYFVFEDPLDESGINLSFADVPTQHPGEAFARVERAADSGELWKAMYPEQPEHDYTLIKSKMMYLDISSLARQPNADTILALSSPSKALPSATDME